MSVGLDDPRDGAMAEPASSSPASPRPEGTFPFFARWLEGCGVWALTRWRRPGERLPSPTGRSPPTWNAILGVCCPSQARVLRLSYFQKPVQEQLPRAFLVGERARRKCWSPPRLDTKRRLTPGARRCPSPSPCYCPGELPGPL